MNQLTEIQQMSDAALLALVCAHPQEQHQQQMILERTWRWHQRNWRTLAKSTEWDLLEIYGIDQALARRIIGIFEISKRYQSAHISQRRHIKASKDVYNLLQLKLADLDHEQFYVLYLN
jgi:DNA repair protein RadC